MSWDKIKKSLNSTLGTPDFKPLDQIIKDEVGGVRSDLENGVLIPQKSLSLSAHRFLWGSGLGDLKPISTSEKLEKDSIYLITIYGQKKRTQGVYVPYKFSFLLDTSNTRPVYMMAQYFVQDDLLSVPTDVLHNFPIKFDWYNEIFVVYVVNKTEFDSVIYATKIASLS